VDLHYNKTIIEDIEIIISKRSQEILNNPDIEISDYVTLFRSFIIRSNFFTGDGFTETLELLYKVKLANDEKVKVVYK